MLFFEARLKVNRFAWQVAAGLVRLFQRPGLLLVELISLGQKLLGVRLLLCFRCRWSRLPFWYNKQRLLYHATALTD
jgi:hypothetical protein